MADATSVAPEMARTFAGHLAYLEHRFAELEEVARSWSELTSQDQNEFLLDWPVVEDRLHSLRALVRREGLPARYRASYQRLDERILRDRSILERLQAS